MGQNVLTDIQKKALIAVASEPKLSDFYFTGGTALAAYYFQHRLSNDLDFFIATEPDKQFLHIFAERLKTIIGASSYRFEHLYDRNIFLFPTAGGELKSEFAKAQRIEALPKMIKPLIVEELKTFFSELAKTLRKEVIEE